MTNQIFYQLLTERNQDDQYIYFHKNDQCLSLKAKNLKATDKAIKKLSFHEIIDKIKKFDKGTLNQSQIDGIILSLSNMAKATEKKYFSGYWKILKIFSAIFNGVSGRGLHTTVAQANQLISELKQLKSPLNETQVSQPEIPVLDPLPVLKVTLPLQPNKTIKEEDKGEKPSEDRASEQKAPPWEQVLSKYEKFLKTLQEIDSHPFFKTPFPNEEETIPTKADSENQKKEEKTELEGDENVMQTLDRFPREFTLKENQEPQAITYRKGETKTNEVIPTHKEPIGSGVNGSAYVHKEDPFKVVKKSHDKNVSFEDEFKIGASLNHPTLVKHFQLYIKQWPNQEFKQKLVMEKVEGVRLDSFMFAKVQPSAETFVDLLSQAKNCCLYLNIKKVIWADLNAGNIFITQNGTGLKIIDFGFWRTCENPQERAVELLFESIKLITTMMNNMVSFKSLENRTPIIFPMKFFGNRGSGERMPYFKQKVKTMNDEEIQTLLKDYFDQVIEAFKQAMEV